MVNEPLYKAGQWVRKHLDKNARDAWLAAPWIVKLLISYEGAPTDGVQNKDAVMKARIREVQKYLAWDTDNMRPDRLRRWNLAWQGAWSRVPTKMIDASPW